MKKTVETAAILLAAGSGNRSGLGYNKALHFFGKKNAVEMSMDALFLGGVELVMVACRAQDILEISEIAKAYGGKVALCQGGETRTLSVERGLNALSEYQPQIVVIHDSARPFVTEDIVKDSIDSAKRQGSGVAAVKAVDTILIKGEKPCYPDRTSVHIIQTPQTFNYQKIQKAYEMRDKTAVYTDDSAVFSAAGFEVELVEGSFDNKKVTNPTDFHAVSGNTKIGHGYDVHRLVEGRPLILGGVRIDYERGLEGHSDADVVTHALMDALLSGNGLKDIGTYFPDTDPQFLGADSLELLKKVVALLNCSINSVSICIMCQKPKIAPFIEQMKRNFAKILGIDAQNIGITATTTEGLGIVGEGKAIAASCVVACGCAMRRCRNA